MSAINVVSPWRSAYVYAPDAGFGQAERQAAAFMYSGILAATLAPEVIVTVPGLEYTSISNRMHYVSALNRIHYTTRDEDR